ncbi:MAG: hypothetical protein K2P78_04270 [Gemmataceae bacterium]|nr:hypothetical protein [Gemmataceae bacterium]
MSTTAAPAAEPKSSPAEYVRALPPEDKQAVFLALLRELIEINGGGTGLISIDDEDGRPLGYYVPPDAAAAAAAKAWAEIPPAARDHLGRPVRDLQNSISADELLMVLSPEGGGPPRSRALPPPGRPTTQPAAAGG